MNEYLGIYAWCLCTRWIQDCHKVQTGHSISKALGGTPLSGVRNTRRYFFWTLALWQLEPLCTRRCVKLLPIDSYGTKGSGAVLVLPVNRQSTREKNWAVVQFQICLEGVNWLNVNIYIYCKEVKSPILGSNFTYHSLEQSCSEMLTEHKCGSQWSQFPVYHHGWLDSLVSHPVSRAIVELYPGWCFQRFEKCSISKKKMSSGSHWRSPSLFKMLKTHHQPV